MPPRRPRTPPTPVSEAPSIRCTFREGRRRCARNGSGAPVLCRAHRLILNEGLEPEGAVARAVERVDRAVARDPFWSTIVDVAQEFWGRRPQQHPIPTPHAPPPRAPRGPAGPPPPRRDPPRPQPDDPRIVLGFPPGSRPSREEIKSRQRKLASIYHPDVGGSLEAMTRLNDAVKKLLKEMGG
jgi:hypothetical protein